MKHILSNSRFNSSQPNTQSTTLPVKLTIFNIGQLTVALPIEKVHKIINHTLIQGSGQSYVGITHIDDCEVTVVDLHQRFFGSPQLEDINGKGYLVLLQNNQGELFSIPTTNIPTLIEVPLSGIRELPESYRRADTLEIASHVTMVPQTEKPLTIFILDVNRLLPASHSKIMHDLPVKTLHATSSQVNHRPYPRTS